MELSSFWIYFDDSFRKMSEASGLEFYRIKGLGCSHDSYPVSVKMKTYYILKGLSQDTIAQAQRSLKRDIIRLSIRNRIVKECSLPIVSMDIDTVKGMLIGGDGVVMLKEHLTAPVLCAHIMGVAMATNKEYGRPRENDGP